MIKLPKFVIELNRLNNDITKVSLLLEKFEQDRKLALMDIIGVDLLYQAQLLKLFPSQLFSIIEDEAAIQGKDVFGSEFIGINNYTHIEFGIDPTYKVISAIRLLREEYSSQKDFEKKRYTIFTVNNTIDPTTINIVSNIREISDQVSELYGISGISENLKCGDDANVINDVANDINSVVGLPEVNLAGSAIQSQITWSDFVNTYFWPKAQIVARRYDTLRPVDIKELSRKYDQNSVKTAEEVEAENKELASASFKINLLKTRSGGYELNNAGSYILANPDVVRSEIAGAVGDPVAVLNSCYSQIFDKFSLGCLIKSAAECIIPPLTCKEILRGLRVDTIQERLQLVFPNQPRIVDLVNQEIQILREQNPDAEISTDQFLDAIENFIDLEALCDIVNFLSTGFSVPTIELPTLPIVDLFASVSVEIENAILEALLEAIKNMILGILEDLASCDTLDAFIAGTLQGEYGPDSGIAGDLVRLFAGDTAALTDPTKGAIASSLGRRWDEFAVNSDNILRNIVRGTAVAGASVAEGAITLTDQIDVVGGISGLAKAVQNGDMDELTATTIIQNYIEGKADITELLNFSGPGSESLNNILKEIGRYELSDDGNTFTLRRISDDQVVTIIQNYSKLQPKILDFNTKEITNSIGKALDDVVSVLSPGETLELFAGQPTEQTITIVREVVRYRHPDISDLVPDPVQLFISFGKITGLNQLKDNVILLAQADSNREIPRKYCIEDDHRMKIRKDILVRGGLNPNDADREIQRIVDIRVERYNNLISILTKNGDFTPEDILENIKCGTGVQPNGLRPPIIEDQLNATINIILEPVKMAFDREVPKYVDAISSTYKVPKLIPRLVDASDNSSIFGSIGGDSAAGTALQSFADLLGNLGIDTQTKTINPEFQKLVSQGFVPKNEDGTTDGNPNAEKGPYTDGVKPIITQDVARKTAGLFVDGIKIDENKIQLNEDQTGFEIAIKGSLHIDSPIKEYVPSSTPDPEWLFKYSEKNGVLNFKIKSRGDLQSKLYGQIPFSENYSLSKPARSEISDEILSEIENIDYLNPQELNRKNVYSSIIFNKIKPVLLNQNSADDQIIKSFFDASYETYIKDFIRDAGLTFSNNRLLKKVPDKSLKNLGTNINTNSQSDLSQLIVLNLINFAPTPTDDQIRCKSDPHLLDLEFIKKLVKEQFDKECEDPNDPNDGLSSTRKPINSAAFLGAVMATIRLYVVEYILRSLFIYDEYGYSESFADDPLLIDYISTRIKEDLERLEFWSDFERELPITYENLVSRGQIKEDEISKFEYSVISNSEFQGVSFDSPYKSNAKTTLTNASLSQLKVLVSNQMKSVFKKIKAIVGFDEQKEYKFEKAFLNGISEMDVYSNFELLGQDSFTSNNQRFVNKKSGNAGRFVLEKYIRVPQSTSSVIKSQQSNQFLKDVVAINNWNEFLVANPTFAPLRFQDTFDESWKFGVRLVYITDAIGQPTNNPTTPPFYNSMNFGDSKKLNSSIVEREKAYYFMEKVDKNGEGEEYDVPMYQHYNSIIIAEEEESISFDLLSEVVDLLNRTNKLEELFENNFKQSLIDSLSENSEYKVFLNYSLMSDKLRTLMTIYSTFAINSEEMKFLFEGTKLQLKKLFQTLVNLGDYTFRPDLGAAENAIQYKNKFNRIGHPAGPSGPDALYLAAITPILILKGIVELTDPNIWLSSKIITAAAAGYFSPKFERASGTVKIQNSEKTINILEEVIATDSQFIQDPDSGELRVLDEAVRYTEDGQPVLKENVTPGLPLIKYTKVMEPELDAAGNVSLDANGWPLIKNDNNGNPIIKSGPGPISEDGTRIPVKGIRYPGGETSLFDTGQTVDNFLQNITFGTFDPGFDIVESQPVYPGESLNLPYNLVSPALLPINVWGWIVPWIFCGPPINPFIGANQFLPFEPLLYQMPYFQSMIAKSDAADLVKKEFKVDLTGFTKIKCEDEKE